MIEEMGNRPVLIFGCGNVLFGDDGFGPAVIAYLEEHHCLPDSVLAVDAGTAISGLLFDLLLLPAKPELMVIVDAFSQAGRVPGEVFSVALEHLPAVKSGNFGLHQFPSVNLLQELQDEAGVEVRILAVQVADIPDRVRPGLSAEVGAAVPEVCTRLLHWTGGMG
jgi:coenzyme F420 hydrogenase subunit delta